MKITNIELDYFLPLLSATAVLRKEEYFLGLLNYALQQNFNSEKIYETLLQTYLFAGFPVALNSLKIFSEYFKVDLIPEKYDVKAFKERGIVNCKKVYNNAFEKLIHNVSAFSPELSEWLLIEGYGKTLSRNNLGMMQRELCIVSILTVLRFEDQLISHIKGSLRFGNSVEKINNSLNNLKLIDENDSSLWGLKVLQGITFK